MVAALVAFLAVVAVVLALVTFFAAGCVVLALVFFVVAILTYLTFSGRRSPWSRRTLSVEVGREARAY